MASMEEEVIKKEIRRINRILKQVPADRKPIAQRLAEEIAFMSVTLARLRKTITEKGVVENFKQGKQQFMRESPALKGYNTTIQRYSLLYKQITDLLPKPEAADNATAEILECLKRLEGGGA